MTSTHRGGDWWYVDGVELVSVNTAARVSLEASSGTFIADTLTTANTGVPPGTSLTDQGSITYSSANNGQTITGKRFTGRVTVTGANITFVNCLFDFGDWFQLDTSAATGPIVCNFCTFDLKNWSSGGSAVYGKSTTLFRCQVLGFENGGKFTADSTIDQCLIHSPADSAVAGAHVDGWEFYEGSGFVVRDSKIAVTNGSTTWSGAGGTTAALNFSTDVGSISGVAVERCRLSGGAYAIYFDEKNGHTIRGVTFVDNLVNDYLYGPVAADTALSFTAATGNYDQGTTSTPTTPGTPISVG